MTLYVDGCSFIRASGLPVEYRISTQIGADADFSVEGKSNMQIVKDLRDNISRYDTFILSFTFSNRFVVFYKGMDECPLNMLPTVIDKNFFLQTKNIKTISRSINFIIKILMKNSCPDYQIFMLMVQ